MSFRDRFFTPKVARATTSPSAILATGAGAAVGILAFGPIGAVLGLGAYAARVLAAVPGAPARPGTDPRSLAEPWRGFMSGVLDARARYDRALTPVRPGPLRERLVDLGTRLDAAVDEAGRVARAGDLLSSGRAQIDVDAVRAELDAARSGPTTSRSEQTIAAITAQLESAERLDRTIFDTYDRLRLLDARLDETVTRTVELAATQADVTELGGIGSEVDAIVSEMESLRQAVEETGGSAAP